jgi:hypothetical protein
MRQVAQDCTTTLSRGPLPMLTDVRFGQIHERHSGRERKQEAQRN